METYGAAFFCLPCFLSFPFLPESKRRCILKKRRGVFEIRLGVLKILLGKDVLKMMGLQTFSVFI